MSILTIIPRKLIRYLSQQLATRELYTRVLYYESGDLCVGVDKNSPCFYPGEILMNLPAEELYRRAALTGESVTGTIRGSAGRAYGVYHPGGRTVRRDGVPAGDRRLCGERLRPTPPPTLKDFAMVSVRSLPGDCTW